MIIKRRSREFLPLIVLIFAKLIFQLVVLNSGFIAISGDDFFRSLISNEWSKSPFFATTSIGDASVLWLPMHFWLVGSILRVFSNFWLAPIFVNIVFSLLSIVALYFLFRALFSKKIAFYATALASCLTWQIWTGNSGISTPVYQFFIITGLYFFIIRNDWKKSAWPVVLASFSFAFANAIRPEAWFFTSVFLILLFISMFAPREHRISWWVFAGAVIITMSFILFWFVYNFIHYQDVFHFVRLSQVNYQFEAGQLDSPMLRALMYPALIVILAPILSIYFCLSLFRCLKEKNKKLVDYVIFILGNICLLIISGSIGIGTNSTPQRYVIIYVVLFCPLAVYFVFKLKSKSFFKALSIVLLCFVALNNLYRSFYYSQNFIEEKRVGEQLKSYWAEGRLGKDDFICSERTLRILTGTPYPFQRDSLLSLPRKWAIQVFSNNPDNFLFGINQGSSIQLAPHPELESISLGEYLTKKNIKIIILRGTEMLASIPDNFRVIKKIHGYILFSSSSKLWKEDLFMPPSKIRHPIEVDFNESLTFKGFNYYGGIFPQEISFFFEPKEELKEDFVYQIEFVSEEDESVRLEWIYKPFMGMYSPSRWEPHETIEDVIPFPFEELSPDYYYIRLKILSSNEKVAMSEDAIEGIDKEVIIGPIRIIESKRQIIREFLQLKEAKLKLLLNVLYFF